METQRATALLSDVTESYDRLTEDELRNLGIVLGAYRSFRGNRRGLLAYVSMPITSGKRYFDVLTEHGVTSAEELAAKAGKDALYELVIKPNIREGVAFADQLGETRKDLLFIAPSVFEAKKWRWSQDAYMSLWYRVIGELTGKHYLMDGWEYSTGGVKEVMFTVLMQNQAFLDAFRMKDFLPDVPEERLREEYWAMREVRIYDAQGQDINVIKAVEMIVAAVADLRKRGLPCQELIPPTIRMADSVISLDTGRLPISWYDRLFDAKEALLNSARS
ncbi:MAG: hypothetical protein QY323_05705 [Patescibacteria group bacterium]|nr:MAG: hypothetical protein QY323_05705 [Patescibacteria group bacterium]